MEITIGDFILKTFDNDSNIAVYLQPDSELLKDYSQHKSSSDNSVIFYVNKYTDTIKLASFPHILFEYDSEFKIIWFPSFGDDMFKFMTLIFDKEAPINCLRKFWDDLKKNSQVKDFIVEKKFSGDLQTFYSENSQLRLRKQELR